MTKLRVVMLGVAAALALAWALPALARPAKTTAKVVNVVAGKPSEFKYTFSPTKFSTGTYTFKLTDSGTLPHDIKICSSNKGGTADTCAGTDSTTISPGGAASITVTFKTKGTYEYLCTLPGHAAAGMKGDLKVT